MDKYYIDHAEKEETGVYYFVCQTRGCERTVWSCFPNHHMTYCEHHKKANEKNILRKEVARDFYKRYYKIHRH